MSIADTKAAAGRAFATGRRTQPQRIHDPDLPAGVAMWRVGDAIVAMPALKPGAPSSVRRVYRDRLIANTTGECPRCGAVADIARRISVAHERGCRVSDDGQLGRWIDPAGWWRMNAGTP